MFFNISSTNPEPVNGTFFKWLDTPGTPLDLNALMPPDFSMHNYILGYLGTETVPTCQRGVCWYFVNGTNYISHEHFNMIKIPDVPANVRKVQVK